MFRPYGIVGKDFVAGNNMCWNIMIVLQERLKRDHHEVSDVSAWVMLGIPLLGVN